MTATVTAITTRVTPLVHPPHDPGSTPFAVKQPEVAAVDDRRYAVAICDSLRGLEDSRLHPVLDVGDAGGFDGPELLELDIGCAEVVEKPRAATEQHRNDV